MQLIDDQLIAEVTAKAAASGRRRQHFNLHADYADPCQRLLNVLWYDSYIAPHRHSADPKEETLVALRGELGCVQFDDAGLVIHHVRLTAGGSNPLVVIHPGEWHTLIALTDTAVLLETKAGPFDPAAAKEPAPWACDEMDPGAASYLSELRALFESGPLSGA